MYYAIKVLHILSSMVFGGGVVLSAFLYVRAARFPELRDQVLIYRRLKSDVSPLITGSGILAISSGVLLAVAGSWPILRGWILLSLIWMVVEGAAAFALDRGKRARRSLGEAALAGAASIDAARRAFSSSAVFWSALLNTSLILGYVVLMVVKPLWP